MSYRALDWAMSIDGLSGNERSVLVCLAWRMNDKTGQCNPSIDSIRMRMGVGRDQVRNAIRSLCEKCLIVRIDSAGATPSYRLLVTPVQSDTPTQSSTPTQLSTPTQMSTTQSSTPTQTSTTPLLDQVGEPYSIEYPNKEENKEENTTVVGAEVSEPLNEVHPLKTQKRSPLTYLFKDSGITELPSGWRKYCEERRPDVNPDHAFADFRAWFVDGKGADERRGEKGWNSSWQGWVRRQKEQAYRNGYAQPANDSASIVARIKAMQQEDMNERL